MAKTKPAKKAAAKRAVASTSKASKVEVVLVVAQSGKAFTVSAEFNGMSVPLYECGSPEEARRRARAWARRAPGRRPRPLKGVLVGACSLDDRIAPAQR